MSAMTRPSPGARRILVSVGLLGAMTLFLMATAAASQPHGHVYYAGPASDHFDGHRFFNPDGEQGTGGQQRETTRQLVGRAFHKTPHRSWPKSAPVARSVPPARVEGEAMRVTWIGHSTALVQTQGLNILLDPVWAQRDSPVRFAGPRRVRQRAATTTTTTSMWPR